MRLIATNPGSSSPRASRLRSALVSLAVLAGAVLVYCIRPERSILVCPFHEVTGLYCPGCGTYRALHHLLHGRLHEAIDHNALTLLVLPFLSYVFVSRALHATTGRSLPRILVPARAIRALAVAFVLFWVLRNLPLFPFTLLSP